MAEFRGNGSDRMKLLRIISRLEKERATVKYNARAEYRDALRRVIEQRDELQAVVTKLESGGVMDELAKLDAVRELAKRQVMVAFRASRASAKWKALAKRYRLKWRHSQGLASRHIATVTRKTEYLTTKYVCVVGNVMTEMVKDGDLTPLEVCKYEMGGRLNRDTYTKVLKKCPQLYKLLEPVGR